MLLFHINDFDPAFKLVWCPFRPEPLFLIGLLDGEAMVEGQI